jgi:A/G-specific adenine glycosylase
MDLGAMLCTPRNPDCPSCPLMPDCQAFLSGRPERFPKKPAKPAIVEQHRVAAVIRRGDRYLVLQRGDHGRWAGMWEFPSRDLAADEDPASSARALASTFDIGRATAVRLPDVRHGIMHYRIVVACFLFHSPSRRNPSAKVSARWATVQELGELPMSIANRRIVTFLTNAPVGETRPAPEPG